jgi:predicted extracellular nuclease
MADSVRGKLRVLRGDGSDDTILISIDRFQRPVLRAEVQLRAETTAIVFVAHLKSKSEQIFEQENADDPIVQALGNARSLIVRAAEAAALRALIIGTATGNKKPIIVLGDLNDDLVAVTTQMIAGDDPFFLQGEKKQAAFDRLLYSVHDIQERLSHRQVNYSHIYNRRYELLDHIFVSEELVAQNPAHIAEVRNTRMYNDHLFDSQIATGHNDSPASTSDHGIPVTEIQFTKAPTAN